MSTDFDAVCDACKVRLHAGQARIAGLSFGYSSFDEVGRKKVAAFVMRLLADQLEWADDKAAKR